MSKTRFAPVPGRIVEAARQARARGLSLRAIAADLATRDMLSPSNRPYLPGSIAAMLRDHDHVDVLPVIDDPDVEMDQEDLEPPIVDAESAAPAVDAAPPLAVDAAHGLPVIDSPPIDAEQLPAVDVLAEPVVDAARGLPVIDADVAPQPEPIGDAAPPAVDKPRWEARRGPHGVIDATHLLRRLSEFPDLQAPAMASAGLRVEHMEVLFSKPSACEAVANYLHWHS